MKTKLTLKKFERWNPCAESRDFVDSCGGDFMKMWKTCERGDWMIWGLIQMKKLDKAMAVRIAVECAKHVLPIFESKYPEDSRPRKAIESVELWLKYPSEINHSAADNAANAAANAANAAANAANAAARMSERKWQADKIRELIPDPFQYFPESSS